MGKEDIKKTSAKQLFLLGLLTQQEIAAAINVSEKTMSLWVKQGGWETQKNEQLDWETRTLGNVRKILDHTGRILAERAEMLASEGKMLTPGELDGFAKTFKLLEKDTTTMAEVVRISKELLEFVNKESPSLAQQLMPLVTKYIGIKGASKN